jgi:hypothetical protein
MPDTTKSEIFAVEEKLRLAMLNSDVEALDELLSSELIFTNHLGQVLESKMISPRIGVGCLKLVRLNFQNRISKSKTK